MTTPHSHETAIEAPARRIEVDLIEDAGDWPDVGEFSAIVQRVADAVVGSGEASCADHGVAVVLSSDAAVAALNGNFRGKAKPTNVLSFPAGAGAPHGFLGDIVLARETVAREAEEQGIAFLDHVQHLVVHGLLHLLGYDHETSVDAERMEALEIVILASLGIDNPYTGELDATT